MQVQVFPAHGDLDNGMLLGDGGVADHQQAAPNHGTTVAQHHLELIHLTAGLWLAGIHVMAPAVFAGLAIALRGWNVGEDGVQRNERFSGTAAAARISLLYAASSAQHHTTKLIYDNYIPVAAAEVEFRCMHHRATPEVVIPMRIGYGRVSTSDQSLNLQQDA